MLLAIDKIFCGEKRVFQTKIPHVCSSKPFSRFDARLSRKQVSSIEGLQFHVLHSSLFFLATRFTSSHPLCCLQTTQIVVAEGFRTIHTPTAFFCKIIYCEITFSFKTAQNILYYVQIYGIVYYILQTIVLKYLWLKVQND